MTTYEKLDWIADSVIPTLAVIALLVPWLPMYRVSAAAWKRVVCTLLSVAAAYLGMALDQLTGAWPALSMDYSTHSAVSVALLVSLSHFSRRWMIASIVIGVSYAALMVYQRYHSVQDIVSTAVLIGLIAWFIWRTPGLSQADGVQLRQGN